MSIVHWLVGILVTSEPNFCSAAQRSHGARQAVFDQILRKLVSALDSEQSLSGSRTLAKAELSALVPKRVGCPEEFVSSLWKLLAAATTTGNSTSVALILDHAHSLYNHHPDITYTLLRLHDYRSVVDRNYTAQQHKYVRNANLIFVGRSPIPEDILQGAPQPPSVMFQSYAKQSARNVLQRSFCSLALPVIPLALPDNCRICNVTPDGNHRVRYIKRQGGGSPIKDTRRSQRLVLSGKRLGQATQCHRLRKSPPLDFSLPVKIVVGVRGDGEGASFTITDMDLRAAWEAFINEMCRQVDDKLRTDFHEMRFVTRSLWVLFLESVFEGNRQLIEEDLGDLKLHLRAHCGKALKNLYSHFTPDLRDHACSSRTVGESWDVRSGWAWNHWANVANLRQSLICPISRSFWDSLATLPQLIRQRRMVGCWQV
eukprot:GHVN01034870.1.p1 GENE.GHVN01034870.1~~GHVN01034870.1.p1  ORF type:complete len:428 (+),score=19.09 GHVN01034870.1:166-1449(+)